MSKSILSKILFILSMVIFGTIGLFVKLIPLQSGEIVLYRAVLATILIALYFLFTKHKISFSKIKKYLLLLVISGGVMGFNWILLFEAYNFTTVSIATLSYYFAPIIVTIMCPILFKEKLTASNILFFVLSTIGLVLIIGVGDVSSSSNHIFGILLGLGAAIFYASVILINKFIKDIDGIERTFFQFISATIVILPYVLLTSGINVFSVNLTELIFLLIIGLVHTGICYCMYFSSLKDIPGQQVALLSYIDPLVAIIMSTIFLKESITLIQIIGGILIIGSAVANELLSIKKVTEESSL